MVGLGIYSCLLLMWRSLSFIGNPFAADPLKDLSLEGERESSTGELDDEDEIPDLADLEDTPDDPETLTNRSPAAEAAGSVAGDGIRRTRTYDLIITYDKYYQVPRFWLIGYDEQRRLLTPEQAGYFFEGWWRSAWRR